MEDATKEKLDGLKAAIGNAERDEKTEIYREFTTIVMGDETIDSPEKISLIQEMSKLI